MRVGVATYLAVPALLLPAAIALQVALGEGIARLAGAAALAVLHVFFHLLPCLHQKADGSDGCDCETDRGVCMQILQDLFMSTKSSS
jgi:hypothetical protein